MPAPTLARGLRNSFSIIRLPGSGPDFSGTLGQIQHDGQQTKSGKRIDEKGALRVAAIWIATTVLADEIASLTMKLVRKDDAKREPQQPPKLSALWSDDPNPDQTRYGLEASETLSQVLWGYSATWLGWTNGGALETRWVIDPSKIKLERTEKGGLRLLAKGQGTLVNEPGERPEFEFVPLYQLPGQLEPVSPVRMAAELAGLSQAYDETAARFAKSGFKPSALVTVGETLDEKTSEELTKRLDRLHGGSAKSGGIAAIGGKDVKIQPYTMSMVDAQVVAQEDRVFYTLMAMWRIPPTVAGMVDKPSTWGTGIAEFSRGLERFTLRPLVERRQAAHRKYITRWVDADLHVKYFFDSLLSASPKERTEIQRTKLLSGMTSQERILAQNDEPPFEEAETVFSQLAMAADEDRDLDRLRKRAETYSAFIRAGVTPGAAAKAAGFDPAELEHTGATPVTVQSDE